MNITSTEQFAVPMQAANVSRRSELLTRDIGSSPVAIGTGKISPDQQYEAKTRFLDNNGHPPLMAASAPQLTPPAALPEAQDAPKLVSNLKKIGGIGLKIDEETLVSFVMQAAEETYMAPLDFVVKTYTPNVDDRIRALLRRYIDNESKSRNDRVQNIQYASDFYSAAVKAKVVFIEKQGMNGFTGSLGASLGSFFIATGGLTVQGRASDIKTNIIQDKEKIYSQKQLLRSEQRDHLELKQELQGGLQGNLKKMAYQQEKNQVDIDITDADQRAQKAGERIEALKAENRQLAELGADEHSCPSLEANNKRIQELETERTVNTNRKTELEQQKPARLREIESEHSDIVSLIEREKVADSTVNMHHDSINQCELKIEGQSIDAERQHTIGWTIVNLQTMAQTLQSGFGVAVKNNEAAAVNEDAAINAATTAIQMYDANMAHDQTSIDGSINALQSIDRSRNDARKRI